MNRCLTHFVVIAWLSTGAAVRAQAPVPLGGEVVVATSGYDPRAAVDVDGRIVISWTSPEIQARRFDAEGVPLGSAFQVNDYTNDIQAQTDVTFSSGGNFVIAWASFAQFPGMYHIVTRPFGPDGQPLGPSIDASTLGGARYPRLVANTSGAIVLTWLGGTDSSIRADVYQRRLTSAGAPLGAAGLATVNTSYDQNRQDVAIAASGDYVVVWDDEGRRMNTDPGEYNVFLRRFNAMGASLTGDVRVNTTVPGKQSDPAVAMSPDGAFAVVWTGVGSGGAVSVYMQRYGADGAPWGGETRVTDTVVPSYASPQAVMRPSGEVIVVWVRSDGGVMLRSFDRNGVAASSEVGVGTTPTEQPSGLNPTVPVSAVQRPDGSTLIVAWQGAARQILMQRFSLVPVAGEATPEEPAALAVSVAPVPAKSSGATVRYTLDAPARARLSVLDALGREVAVLADGEAAAGPHDVRLDARGLPPGVYVVRLVAGGAIATARVPVVR